MFKRTYNWLYKTARSSAHFAPFNQNKQVFLWMLLVRIQSYWDEKVLFIVIFVAFQLKTIFEAEHLLLRPMFASFYK